MASNSVPQKLAKGITIAQIDDLYDHLRLITAIGDALATGAAERIQEQNAEVLGHTVFRAGNSALAIVAAIGDQGLSDAQPIKEARREA
ncbi:hypothetical protein HDC36_003407 [Xanthomonas sp. JAI131]|uniref:hypothetical protein n=1 Tax=Xanthomonas sp. JAI131 TaxID=2723067 RepID=UPI0015C9ED2E|nr:hypothetical protein [Xanthomonas sp. JAI131]NYF21931.1 hypothetical protein [Xanthomonas sp. JAI131]